MVIYLFDIFSRHEKLKSKVLDTLLEFCTYCKDQFNSEVVTAMHSFMTQNYATLSLAHAQKLIEALSLVTSAIDKENFASNLQSVSQLPLQSLTQANE